MRVGKIKRTAKEKRKYRSNAYVRFHTKAVILVDDDEAMYYHMSKISKILKHISILIFIFCLISCGIQPKYKYLKPNWDNSPSDKHLYTTGVKCSTYERYGPMTQASFKRQRRWRRPRKNIK